MLPSSVWRWLRPKAGNGSVEYALAPNVEAPPTQRRQYELGAAQTPTIYCAQVDFTAARKSKSRGGNVCHEIENLQVTTAVVGWRVSRPPRKLALQGGQSDVDGLCGCATIGGQVRQTIGDGCSAEPGGWAEVGPLRLVRGGQAERREAGSGKDGAMPSPQISGKRPVAGRQALCRQLVARGADIWKKTAWNQSAI